MRKRGEKERSIRRPFRSGPGPQPVFAERSLTTWVEHREVSGGFVKLPVEIQLVKARKLALEYIFVVFERKLTHRKLSITIVCRRR
jgi:hypothetical protein